MTKKLLIILLLGVISISLTGCLSMLFPESNNPPVITPIPDAAITVGETFTYNVYAIDPDGDVLTYSLLGTPPEGMNINENSGVISWTPTTVGSFEVTVEVSDGELTDAQSFSITVSEPPNQAPVITSTPVTSVILGETFFYIVEAIDPNGNDLTYSLIDTPPSGMTIDSTTGAINWTPTAIGSFEVTVKVSNGELSSTQSFTIEVIAPKRVVIVELYMAIDCSHCEDVEPILEQLVEEYGYSQMVLVEEASWGEYSTAEISNRYKWYFPDIADRGVPNTLFNGLNDRIHGSSNYSTIKNKIDVEIAKGTKIYINASRSSNATSTTISGTIGNISNSTLSTLEINGIVFKERQTVNLKYSVTDIFDEQKVEIISLVPGGSHEFSFTLQGINWDSEKLHGVIFVQAPNSPTKEILQALYVE